jgi:hypothetical protein
MTKISVHWQSWDGREALEFDEDTHTIHLDNFWLRVQECRDGEYGRVVLAVPTVRVYEVIK